MLQQLLSIYEKAFQGSYITQKVEWAYSYIVKGLKEDQSLTLALQLEFGLKQLCVAVKNQTKVKACVNCDTKLCVLLRICISVSNNSHHIMLIFIHKNSKRCTVISLPGFLP